MIFDELMPEKICHNKTVKLSTSPKKMEICRQLITTTFHKNRRTKSNGQI